MSEITEEEHRARMAQFLADTRQRIAESQWVVMNIFPTEQDPGTMFHYTVGLSQYGLPELEMTGLPPEVAGSILNGLGQQMLDSEAYTHGQRLAGHLSDGKFDLVLIEADNIHHDEYPTAMARLLYGEDIKVLQAVWPDDENRFPWDEGYSIHPETQILFGDPP